MAICATAMLAACAHRDVDAAAQAAVRGDLDAAERLLPETDDPKTLLVRFGVALERGEFETAESLARRLLQAAPGTPDALVAMRLYELRRAQPAAKWFDLVPEAMQVAASGSKPTIFSELSTKIDARLLDASKLDDANRFLVLLDRTPAKDRGTLVELARRVATARNSVTVRLAAATVLGGTPEAAGLVASVAADRPRVLEFRLATILGAHAESEPLSPAEIDALETLVASHPAESPMPEVYEAFRAAYALLDEPSARERAFSATFSVFPTPALVTLLRRARVSMDKSSPAALERLADVLHAAGTILAARGTLVELGNGVSLIGLAAKIHPTDERASLAKSLAGDFRESLRRVQVFSLLDEFPIASLRRELTDAKVTREVELAKRLP